VEILIGVIVVTVVFAALAISLLFRRARRAAPEWHRPTEASSADSEHPQPALKGRLARTRSAISAAVGSVFTQTDGDQWEGLEDALILADVGPTTSAAVVDRVRKRRPESAGEAAGVLKEELIACFEASRRTLHHAGSPGVVVVVGVNGSGKTTTIGKIASDLVGGGTSVLLAAADTFRAAADSQLMAWGDRVGVEVVSGDQGQDPASVAFAAIDKAKAEGIDVVVVDTAGRLHAHTNLMDELAKVVRVAEREAGSVGEVLLVLDGSTGQNGIAQARAFTDAVGVTGVVLTKLDGTAKGGVAVAVESDLGLPIKYIGVGEGVDDLIPFVPSDFVEALIDS
jgi:fused signal recognition particle receptor